MSGFRRAPTRPATEPRRLASPGVSFEYASRHGASNVAVGAEERHRYQTSESETLRKDARNYWQRDCWDGFAGGTKRFAGGEILLLSAGSCSTGPVRTTTTSCGGSPEPRAGLSRDRVRRAGKTHDTAVPRPPRVQTTAARATACGTRSRSRRTDRCGASRPHRRSGAAFTHPGKRRRAP